MSASFGIIFVNVKAIELPSLATVAAVTVLAAPAALVTVKSVASGVPLAIDSPLAIVIVTVVVPAFAA